MLSSEWTKHLESEADKQDFEKTAKNSTFILSRLLDMLQERERQFSTKEVQIGTYDNPSWAFVQAHINGAKAENAYMQRWLKEVVKRS